MLYSRIFSHFKLAFILGLTIENIVVLLSTLISDLDSIVTGGVYVLDAATAKLNLRISALKIDLNN